MKTVVLCLSEAFDVMFELLGSIIMLLFEADWDDLISGAAGREPGFDD